MSGMAGAWHEEEFFALHAVSGIMVAPAAPPGANPANYVGEYFAGANEPFQRFLERILPAVREIVEPLGTAGAVRSFKSKPDAMIKIEVSLWENPFGKLSLCIQPGANFTNDHKTSLCRELGKLCGQPPFPT